MGEDPWRGPRFPFRPISRGASRAVVALFILAFLLSGAAYFFAAQTASRSVASRASVVQLCETGNDFRAQQVTLWEHIIAISAPPPHETPAQERQRKASLAAFDRYVRQVFAPRDCGHLAADRSP